MNNQLRAVPERVTGRVNIEAEQVVIGTVLTNNRAYHSISRFMKPEYFSEQLHQIIWKVASDMIEAGNMVSPITIKTYLPSDATVGSLSLNQYMARLASEAMPADAMKDVAREVVQTYLLRRTIEACEVGIIQSANPAHDVSVSSILNGISTEISKLHEIADRQAGNGMMTLAEAIDTQLDQTAKAFAGEKAIGYDTKLRFLNETTGLWLPGQYIIIGAETKMGKSALAMQTALGISEEDPVLYFSWEMKGLLLATRQLASLTKIGTMRQRSGDVSEAEYERLVTAAGQIKGKENLHITSRKCDIHTVFEMARNFKRQHGKLGAVFVDHLGIAGKPRDLKSNSDWELAAHASPIMKEIAEELNCVTVGLSQLNKENAAYGLRTMEAKIAACMKKPSYGQLKGAIANDADHVIMPFRAEAALAKIEPPEGGEDYLLWENAMRDCQGKAEIVLALSREAHWPKTRECKWDGPATSFVDLESQQGFGKGF